MKRRIVSWPMPHTEMHSPRYELEVEGVTVPVWLARVREEINKPEEGMWTSMLGGPTEWASFARFDADYPVEIAVKVAVPFQIAAVLPHSAGIETQTMDDVVRFTLDRPCHLTLYLDGADEHPLHLFCRTPESNPRQPGDKDTIYFGPGEHWIHSLKVESGQTVYLDGGAILRATLPEGATGKRQGVLNLIHYAEQPVINITDAEDVRICGRGIIDGSLLPHPAKNLLLVNNSRDVHVEGIMLRNSPNWHLPIFNSRDVAVENIACLSGRLNSDGVNCVNSSRVMVRDVFVRSHDDSFVVKTARPQRPSGDILYENCTAWNDWGFAFGISYETRSHIRDVVFRDCEVLFARNWPLGIHVSDSGTVGPVTFERIGVLYPRTTAAPSMSRQCIRLDIAQDEWGKDQKRGHIRDITMRDIHINGADVPPVLLRGLDEAHGIGGVHFENLSINGEAVLSTDDHLFDINEHVRDVSFSPSLGTPTKVPD
jgi:hypothetical protein